MRLLLDTHVLLWYFCDHPRLPQEIKFQVMDRRNQVFVSAISLLEIRIKQRVGKLENIPGDLHSEIVRIPFEILAFTSEHADAVLTLAHHHRDPFDWCLIAQSQCENLTLVTHDNHIHKYDIPILKV